MDWRLLLEKHIAIFAKLGTRFFVVGIFGRFYMFLKMYVLGKFAGNPGCGCGI